MYVDPSGHELLTILMISTLGLLISHTFLSIKTKNSTYTPPSFKEFEFFKPSLGSITIISGGGNMGRKDWYLNEEQDKSFYFTGASAEISLVIEKETKIKKFKDLLNLVDGNVSLFSIGYKDEIIDISIPVGINTDMISMDYKKLFRKIKEFFK